MITKRRPLFADLTRLWVLAVVAAALAAGACGSSSTSVVAPTTQKCQISVNSFTGTFGPSGGSGTATIDAARECSWTAASQANWIALTPPAGGSGAGKISFTVAANTAPRARSGAVDVNGQQLTVSQEAAPCRFSVNPSSLQLGPGGGGGSVSVSASDSSCGWTAESQVPWVRLNTANGAGNGPVGFTATANTGEQRSGTLIVAGQTVPVVQEAAPTTPAPGCEIAVSPTVLSFTAAGGQSNVQVSALAGCPWQAASSAPWLTVTPAQGSGSRGLTVEAAANASASPRTAALSVGGQTVTVTQAGTQSPVPVRLTGSISARKGQCPTLSFEVQGESVVTTADTDFVNMECDKIKNGLLVVVDGVQLPGQPVVATRVRVTGN